MKKNHLLFLALSYLAFFGWLYMKQKHEAPPQELPNAVPGEVTTGTQPLAVSGTPGPATTSTLTATPVTAAPTLPNDPGERIDVRTETYAIGFSTRGAVPLRWDIIDARYALPQYDDQGNEIADSAQEPMIDPRLEKNLDLPRPLEITLRELNSRYYTEFNRGLYDVAQSETQAGDKIVKFTSQLAPNGLRLVKTYTLAPQGFISHLELELTNEGSSTLTFNEGEGGLGLALGPGIGHPSTNVSKAMFNVQRVDTMASGAKEFDSISLSELGASQDFPLPGIEWGAVQNLYFMMAAIDVPLEGQKPGFVKARALIDQNVGVLADTKGNEIAHYPTIELYRDPLTLQPGQHMAYRYELYIGPKEAKPLKEAGHELSRSLFHDSWWGWFRALCLGLMGMLNWFHTIVPNWGVAIILLTLTVKLVTFPLVHKGMKAQAKSAAEMAKIKPLIDKLNEKIKDPAKKQQEMMKLYREHGINPLGFMKGCFWMMIQLPIMAALYRVLYSSIDIRGADFLWVTDLAQSDKLFHIGSFAVNLLPILVCITTFLTSKFTAQVATDPQQAQMQKTMIYVMPVMMLFFTYWLPSGLMVYWLVSNFWQVIQQLYVNKVIRKPEPAI